MATNAEDVIRIDNFSHINGLSDSLEWLLAVYNMFGSFTEDSYASKTENMTALDLKGQAPALANWFISYPIPMQLTKYTVGLSIYGLNEKGNGTPTSASMALVSGVTGSSYSTIFALSFNSESLFIHYKDQDNSPQVKAVPISAPSSPDIPLHLDITFNKVGNQAGVMSDLKIMVDNTLALDEPDIFNNVGSNLQFAFAGVFNTTPDDEVQGFLNTTQVDEEFPCSLNIAIGDLYITRNGKRFGKPRIDTLSMNSISDNVEANNLDDLPARDILNVGPDPWSFVYTGDEPAVATYAPASGEANQVTQITAVAQAQGVSRTASIAIADGDPVERALPTDKPIALYTHMDGDQTEATYKLNN